MTSLNPKEQTKREKRYYTVIKNCSECPFWQNCKVTSFLHDDYRFPTGCLLQDWTGEERENHQKWRSKG